MASSYNTYLSNIMSGKVRRAENIGLSLKSFKLAQVPRSAETGLGDNYLWKADLIPRGNEWVRCLNGE